jgi:hypothetical protein
MGFDVPTFHDLQDHFDFFCIGTFAGGAAGKLKPWLPGVLLFVHLIH